MKVYRSPLRMFIFGLLGLFLILAAVDVMFGHWLSEPPQNNDGVLTTRGQAQQRGDIIWGAALIGTGTLLVGGAVFDLVRRKPQCVVASDGLGLAIGPQEDIVTIPWANVRDVAAETRTDSFDGTDRPVLAVSVEDPSVLPRDPLGATWEGRDLVVEAHGWTKQIAPVASAAQSSLGYSRRSAELMDLPPMDDPSGSWETTTTDADDVPAPEDAITQTAASAGVVVETMTEDPSVAGADDDLPVDEDPIDGEDEE